MAVRFRENRNRWIATIETSEGRYTRHFRTEDEAERFHSLATGQTMARLQCICCSIDWADKSVAQKGHAWRAVEFFGHAAHPAAITMQELDRLVAHLRDKGFASSTIRAYLSATKVMLQRAVRLGWIGQLPLFPEGRTLPLPEPRDLVIRDEWFDELLLCCEKREHRDLYQLLIFLREMGCRLDEATSLRWDRVDLTRCEVQFVKTKACNARRLKVSQKVVAVLKTMQSRYDTPLVFPVNKNGMYVQYKGRKGRNTCRGVIADVCENLGLGKQIADEWCFHTLRHTKITRLAEAGHPATRIQYWAGHKSLAMTQRYIHNAGVGTEELADC